MVLEPVRESDDVKELVVGEIRIECCAIQCTEPERCAISNLQFGERVGQQAGVWDASGQVHTKLACVR